MNQKQEAAIPREHQGKKPYSKPAFRFERVFETSALACGKIHQTQQSCKTNRKKS